MAEYTLYQRVMAESLLYESHEHAIEEHLEMALGHMFEEFEGRDPEEMYSKIEEIYKYFKKRVEQY